MRTVGIPTLAASLFALALLTACQTSKSRSSQLLPADQTQSPAPPAQNDSASKVPAPDPQPAAGVTIPAGTWLRVRLDHSIGTDRNRPGDPFTGSLSEPIKVSGETVIPAGARVNGVVGNAAPSGRLRGRAALSLTLGRMEWNGRSYPLETTAFPRLSAAHKKRNWAFIGGGSGTGALIGGLASGGAGALIGSGAGAAAGTAGAAITGRHQVRLPAESLVSFRLRQALTIRSGPGKP